MGRKTELCTKSVLPQNIPPQQSVVNDCPWCTATYDTVGPGVTSLKYHQSSHSYEGQAEDSQIQESINNTMRHTDYLREAQNNTYCVTRTNVTLVRMKSNEGIVDSEDFPMNTNWKNMQPNKY